MGGKVIFRTPGTGKGDEDVGLESALPWLNAPCLALSSALYIMSPSTKPERDLKVRVPRHNSQRIGPVLTSHVETVAHNERTRADVRQTALEPTSALAQAIVSALVYVRIEDSRTE